jgi:Ca2+-binding RTX toxin-like protein
VSAAATVKTAIELPVVAPPAEILMVSIAVLTVAAADTLVVTGASDITVSAFTSSASITDYDTTGMTGAFVMGAAGQSTAATLFDGGAGNDTFIGNSADDVLKAGTGTTNSLTGGAGDDAYTLGSGVDTVVQAANGAGTAASATTITGAAAIAIGHTITFGNGTDVVTGFTAGVGGDVLDHTDSASTALATALGKTENALTDDSLYFLSGSFATSTGTFTITADGAGADALIIQADAGTHANSTDIMENDSIIVLVGVDTDDLVDAQTQSTSKDSSGAVDLDLGAVASTDTLPTTFTVDASSVVSSTGTLKFNKSETETNLTTAFTVTGGLNADTIYGAKGNDVLCGGAGVNVIGGNAGNDTITDGSGASTLAGDAGADTITGAGGADTITGGAGNDSITGGDGADVITGGAGKDTITLGAGKDTVIFTADSDSAGANFDVITDFVSGTDNLRPTRTMLSTESVFTLSDKGDAASDGTLPGILDGVIGSSAFITEGTAIAIDTTGDGLVNANDFKVEITGNTGFNVDDIDLYLTTGAASTVKSAGGNDSITGKTTVAHTVYSYGGNDTITMAGDADDTIWGGLGNDTIDFGAVAGTDVVIIANGQGTTATSNFTINGAGGADIIRLSLDGSSATTGTGITAVIVDAPTYAGADEGAFDLATTIDTDAVDGVELAAVDTPNRASANFVFESVFKLALALFGVSTAANSTPSTASVSIVVAKSNAPSSAPAYVGASTITAVIPVPVVALEPSRLNLMISAPPAPLIVKLLVAVVPWPFAMITTSVPATAPKSIVSLPKPPQMVSSASPAMVMVSLPPYE